MGQLVDDGLRREFVGALPARVGLSQSDGLEGYEEDSLPDLVDAGGVGRAAVFDVAVAARVKLGAKAAALGFRLDSPGGLGEKPVDSLEGSCHVGDGGSRELLLGCDLEVLTVVGEPVADAPLFLDADLREGNEEILRPAGPGTGEGPSFRTDELLILRGEAREGIGGFLSVLQDEAHRGTVDAEHACLDGDTFVVFPGAH